MKKEIDHEYTDEIVCPYCGHEQSDSWELKHNEGEDFCGSCEKKFTYIRDISVSYSTKQCSCLNGESPHNLKKLYVWNGKNKMKCRECSHEEWQDFK